MKNLTVTTILIAILLIGCSKDDDQTIKREYGIFKVLKDNQTVQMDGVINSNSLKDFTKLIAVFPKINKIDIRECEGSEDDETNLKLSKIVHEKGINTHLKDNGLIASGGVDFFLAGVKRTKGENVKIGVHSWGGTDDSGKKVTATDFPVGHEYHLEYINYYISIGLTAKDAELFYYFTINAASADDIYWMTEEEIGHYSVVNAMQ